MRALGLLNEGLRFLLELAFIVVAFWFGATLGSNAISGLAAGVFLAAIVIAAWGLLAAPKRRFATPRWFPSAMFVLFSVLTVLALLGLGHPALAIAFAVLAAVNEIGLDLGVRTIDRLEAPR